ncbi:MAG TPA: hypothetical protein VK338_03245, partial [Candidatus Nitrosocosmicus sp.]|nr:hypothetical protein [Candidatus Nitrosocosmicus sp.]
MKLKIFFTLLFVLAFFVFSSEKTYAQTCAGQGDPNWCTTGDKWSGTVSRCEYACRYDGYTCTPRCDNVRHYSSCENSETVRCEPVVIGCPRCGNSTDNCFIKRPITPVQPPN